MRSKYRPKQDDERMSEPRAYNLDDPDEIRRLHRELAGYMRVSLNDGTDTEGRAHAYSALCELVRREEQERRAKQPAGLGTYREQMQDAGRGHLLGGKD